MGDGKILTLNLDLLYELGFQLLNTLILIFILSKLLYKPVKKFMDGRAKRIEENLRLASEAKEESRKLRQDYETKLAEIKKEGDQILERAHKKALESEIQIVREAREESEVIKKRTHEDIEKTKESVKEEIRKEILEISTMMARKIVKETLDEERKKQILEETIKEMEELKWLA